MPQEYTDPYAYESDRSIEQAALPAHEQDQLDLYHEDYNPNLWNEMGQSPEMRAQAEAEVHQLALSRFEGPDAIIPRTPELLQPKDEVNGMAALTRSIFDRRALELGLVKTFEPVRYVGNQQQYPASAYPRQAEATANNVYAVPQQRTEPAREPFLTRSYDIPQQYEQDAA